MSFGENMWYIPAIFRVFSVNMTMPNPGIYLFSWYHIFKYGSGNTVPWTVL